MRTDAGLNYEYRYRTLSVAHLPALQEDIDRLRRIGRLSDSATFQSYLNALQFALPADFLSAQTVLIMAIFVPPMTVNFQLNGTKIPATMPPNYYHTGLTRKILQAEIQEHLLGEPGYRVERMESFHLKLLAVRSGLGRYGRNNICYVDGMGSFITLHAYLTDYPLAADHWQEIQMMELCQHCRLCLQQCPGGAIREDDFVINVDRCLPLYNEIPGEFPAWIPAAAHHAVLGCMKCQSPCPANRAPLQRIGQPIEITAEETRQLLSGAPSERVIHSVGQKLKLPYLVDSKEMLGVIIRNVRALLAA